MNKIYKTYQEFEHGEDIPTSNEGISVKRPPSFWCEFTWKTRQPEIDELKEYINELRDECLLLQKGLYKIWKETEASLRIHRDLQE